MPLEIAVGAVLLVSLVLYALLGGADYGGGVWDLLASGPRAAAQRALIAKSLAPIWEANHVWLILAIVVLFTAFPPAFAAIATALHVPLTLVLIGIVLRGSAFTFRAYDVHDDAVQGRWGRIFAVSSLVTPLLLGTTLGAIASGRVPQPLAHPIGEGVAALYFRPWLAPFPLAVGALALALFAYLAAVYLTLETEQRDLREDFRRRALIAHGVVAVLALAVYALASEGAPAIRTGLGRSPWGGPVLALTAGAAVAALTALWKRRFRLARIAAAAQVALVVSGWGLAQYPYLLEPHLTLRQAAAPPATLRALLLTLGAGSLILVPSFLYLFRVFKGGLLGPSTPER
jgi:cytochrome d ubiquinol oxidase subunit II